jgi:hypothetical protein
LVCSPGRFDRLQQGFGVFSVDVFASPENFKVSKYYSYSFLLSCVGVDAFSLSWEDENAYCAPPIALILRVIRKIEVTRMRGVLLIPLWHGARFWLHVFPDGRHLGGVFRSFRQLKVRARSWSISPKDAFAGRWVFFLALDIDSCGDRGHWSRSCRGSVVLAACLIKIVYVNEKIYIKINIRVILAHSSPFRFGLVFYTDMLRIYLKTYRNIVYLKDSFVPT